METRKNNAANSNDRYSNREPHWAIDHPKESTLERYLQCENEYHSAISEVRQYLTRQGYAPSILY